MRKLVLLSCIALSLVLFINGFLLVSRDTPIRRVEAPAPGEISYAEKLEVEPEPQTLKPVNVLILGVDEEGVRSDVIMLANFDPEDGSVNLLSVARDTRIRVRGRYEKINALYAIGKEQLLISAMEQLTDLHINYYITLNFRGFRKVIDTLEGVEFNVPFDMVYDDPDQNLHINLKRGNQILNGQKAEQLVRYRKGNRTGEGYVDGDIGRIKMQQDFMRALIQQKVKLKYISKAGDIYMILKKYMKTNLELSDVNTYARDLRKINYDKVKMFTMPGEATYINNLWYFICDRQKTKELIDINFSR